MKFFLFLRRKNLCNIASICMKQTELFFYTDFTISHVTVIKETYKSSES